MGIRIFAAAIGLVWAGLTAHSACAKDLNSLSEEEVWSLQQRLRDAGCFQAALDGKVTPALAEAVKICPDQDPRLRIETGVHNAVMYRLSVDRECKMLVTGS